MSKKIMEVIPEHLREPLREELRNELIDELKAMGWINPAEPEKKTETEMDQTIAEWAKANKKANPGN